MVAFYLHLGPFSRVVSAAIAKQIEEIDSGHWRDPRPPARPEVADRSAAA